MKGLKSYPDWIVATHREWKKRKRQEWREVEKALGVFQSGCVYVPTYEQFEHLLRLSKEIAQGMSAKEWGR